MKHLSLNGRDKMPTLKCATTESKIPLDRIHQMLSDCIGLLSLKMSMGVGARCFDAHGYANDSELISMLNLCPNLTSLCFEYYTRFTSQVLDLICDVLVHITSIHIKWLLALLTTH